LVSERLAIAYFLRPVVKKTVEDLRRNSASASSARRPKTSRRVQLRHLLVQPGFGEHVEGQQFQPSSPSGFPASVPADTSGPSGATCPIQFCARSAVLPLEEHATDDFPECREIRFDSQKFLHGTIVQNEIL